MSAIGLVILAAGGSRRLGTPKQLLSYEGTSLLRRAAETAVASSCRPIVVVLGASAAQCLPELNDLPVSTVENAQWSEGMGSSIRLGLIAVQTQSPEPLDAVVLMLCDQPLLTAVTLEALVAEYRSTACRLAASEYGEDCGVPALFDCSLFPELLRLDGAQGAKQILRRYPAETHRISFADGAVDIDTRRDCEQFVRP